MSEIESIEAASRRLALALEALDAAVERRLDADREVEALADQVHALGSDRARLAGELDLAAARSRRLESAGREVAQRIDQAIAAIQGALNGGEEPNEEELDEEESEEEELDEEESDEEESDEED